MAGHNLLLRASFRNWKSITGAALVVLGMVILYQNAAGAVAEFRNVLGHNGFRSVGPFPALALTISKGLQDYASDHHFLQDLLRHIVIDTWPLLLVRLGAFLSTQAVSGKTNVQKSLPACRSSRAPFDVKVEVRK